MEELIQKIERLKKENDFVILAHYYVDGAVQDIADYVGDSFYLSKVATKVEAKNILFAGVSFMGESAKLLNPEKHVYMADVTADCPMAHMVTVDRIKEVKEQYDDVAVVCYVNSTAEIKAVSDVCVTSSNAIKVVKNIENKRIFFVPDNNLGRYVAKQLPEKEFIFNDGFCHVHIRPPSITTLATFSILTFLSEFHSLSFQFSQKSHPSAHIQPVHTLFPYTY